MDHDVRWVERMIELGASEINWVVLTTIDERGRERDLDRSDITTEVVEHCQSPLSGEGPQSAYEATNLLHHKHLPQLSEFGLVTYDRDAETVGAGPDFDRGLQTLEHTVKMGIELSSAHRW